MILTDSLAFLIGIQVLVILLLVIGLLILLMRRQKKVIANMQAMLMQYRDDLNGSTLIRHLQQQLDNTAAQCRQSSLALKPDLSPEDMALSLRYSALQAELMLMQESQNGKPRWRAQIKRYEELARSIHDILRARTDHVSRMLQEAHNEALADRDQQIAQLNTTCNDLQQQLQPLQALVRATTDGERSDHELELALQRALLAICDSLNAPDQLRALLSRLHDANVGAVETAANIAS